MARKGSTTGKGTFSFPEPKEPTLGEIAKLLYPDAFKKWDKFSWSVVGPSSLDDYPLITIFLRNRNKQIFQLELNFLTGTPD